MLSACSAYFKKILLDNPCKHPTIILPSEICFSDLRSIIEFVYRGEIDVSEAELQVSFFMGSYKNEQKFHNRCEPKILIEAIRPRRRAYKLSVRTILVIFCFLILTIDLFTHTCRIALVPCSIQHLTGDFLQPRQQ